jgi:hypothetical protein
MYTCLRHTHTHTHSRTTVAENRTSASSKHAAIRVPGRKRRGGAHDGEAEEYRLHEEGKQNPRTFVGLGSRTKPRAMSEVVRVWRRQSGGIGGGFGTQSPNHCACMLARARRQNETRVLAGRMSFFAMGVCVRGRRELVTKATLLWVAVGDPPPRTDPLWHLDAGEAGRLVR